MLCPFCKEGKPGVVNTYGFLDETIPRIRRCHVCGYSFATTEHIDNDADFQERRAEYERKSSKTPA